MEVAVYRHAGELGSWLRLEKTTIAALPGRKPALGTAPHGRDRQLMQDRERSTQSWSTKNAEC